MRSAYVSDVLRPPDDNDLRPWRFVGQRSRKRDPQQEPGHVSLSHVCTVSLHTQKSELAKVNSFMLAVASSSTSNAVKLADAKVNNQLKGLNLYTHGTQR
jgi:hypothetical protein